MVVVDDTDTKKITYTDVCFSTGLIYRSVTLSVIPRDGKQVKISGLIPVYRQSTRR